MLPDEVTIMPEIRVQSANGQPETPEITVEGFGVEEARILKQLLARFMKEYGKKPANQSDEEWLAQRFQAELPGMSAEEALALSRETVQTVIRHDENLCSLNEAREQGRTAEDWFAEKSLEASAGMSAAAFGQRMMVLDQNLENANAQMMRTISTQSGDVSQCLNLDGFIAEQYHVNTFNAAAAASGSSYRAEVCVPEAGQTYGKNSFDIVIKDKSGRIVHQYQSKYGADASATIQMLKDGNYNNQTILVPPEQVEQVQAAFPGKTVVSTIGGTDKVPISSQELSKEGVKEMQRQVQEEGAVPELDWGSYDSRMLAKSVGKQAFVSGMQGAALATGFQLVSKLASEEPIDSEEVVTTALKTGADTGIKTATAGAMKVASEKGIVSIIPKGTPISTITNVTCVAIENVKILGKAATGELTMREALDQMGCNTVSMTFGLSWGGKGAFSGAAALSWVPLVGPIVGGVAGGLVGYMAGSKFGQTVCTAAKAVAKAAKNTVKKVWEGAKALGRRIRDGLRNLLPW